MKIGVVSDTHIPRTAAELPAKLVKGLEGVDLIIHGGDFVETRVIEELREISRFEGVHGNMDPPHVRTVVKRKEVLELGNFKVGVIHGGGSPHGLEERVWREFSDESVDIIIFGHSHTPHKAWRQGVLLFNPGSPTDRIFAPFPSFGMLTLEDEIAAEIIRLE